MVEKKIRMNTFVIRDQEGNVVEEYTEEDIKKMEEENDVVAAMFPDANFQVCIGLEELDEVVSNKDQVVVKTTHICYCYDSTHRNNGFYIVRNEGWGITTKMLIEGLIQDGFHPECNHCFLEGFDKVNDITFSPFFGS